MGQIATYGSLWKAISRYLGKGTNPSGEDLTIAQEIVQDGYGRFLEYHDWHFLRPVLTVSIASGQWITDLPDNFRSLAGEISYTTVEYTTPPVERPGHYIRSLQSLATSTNAGWPTFFAIETEQHSNEQGSRWQMLFWPTPGANYSFYVPMEIYPDDLALEDDEPAGAKEYSRAIKQCCLAEAELQKASKEGSQSARADALLARARQRDARHASGFLPPNTDRPARLSGSRGFETFTLDNNQPSP